MPAHGCRVGPSDAPPPQVPCLVACCWQEVVLCCWTSSVGWTAVAWVTRTAQAGSLVLTGYICRECRFAQAGSLVWTGYICRVCRTSQAGSLVLTGFICRVCPRSHRAVNIHQQYLSSEKHNIRESANVYLS